MKKTNRKGFTIVELIIVIAVIAILAAVLIPVFSNIVKKANVSSDTQLIRNLNEAVAIDKAEKGIDKHDTMYDAVEACKKQGYDVAKIVAMKSSYNIAWEKSSGNFILLDMGTGKVIYPTSVTDSKEYEAKIKTDYYVVTKVDKFADIKAKGYSSYAYGDGWTTLETTKGFDAGDVTTITSIEYDNSSAQDVIIRTNTINTNITIDADSDTVNFYGIAGSITVEHIADASLHIYGIVGFVELKDGHIVVENGGYVGTLYKTATTATAEKKENGYIGLAYATAGNIANKNSSSEDYNVVFTETSESKDALKAAAIATTSTYLQENYVHEHIVVDNKCVICNYSDHEHAYDANGECTCGEKLALTAIDITKASTTIEVGANETLAVTFTPTNAYDKTITWSSGNEAVATVDQTGKVTGVAAGSATITATCGSLSDTCEVTVEAASPYFFQVGETKHETLQAAYNAASSGDTITMLKDYTINSSDWSTKKLFIAANTTKNIIIDLNGKTINCVAYKYLISSDGSNTSCSLTIKNGSIISSDYGTRITFYGNLILDDLTVTLKSKDVFVDSHGYTQVNNCTITASNYYVFGVSSGNMDITSTKVTYEQNQESTQYSPQANRCIVYINNGSNNSTVTIDNPNSEIANYTSNGHSNFAVSRASTLDEKYTPTIFTVNYSNTLKVYGGTYNQSVASSYIPNGYTATESNGVWTVAAN